MDEDGETKTGARAGFSSKYFNANYDVLKLKSSREMASSNEIFSQKEVFCFKLEVLM